MRLCGAAALLGAASASAGAAEPIDAQAVSYAGMMGGKNSLEADLLVRQAGSTRQMKVGILSDSGSSFSKCGYTAGWSDF